MENSVNLKRFRQEKKITQTKAAETIGIDQRQWNRYENGKNDIPVRYVKAICTKFQTSADWLLEIEEETDSKSIKRIINIIFDEVENSIDGSWEAANKTEEFFDILSYTLRTDRAKMLNRFCPEEKASLLREQKGGV